MIDAHLHNGSLRILRHGEQRQRHADFVVEIALRLVCLIFLCKH